MSSPQTAILAKVGIRVSTRIGIGDAVQFTSLPENYFRCKGEMLADLEHHWVFDHNPYVVRYVQKVEEEHDLWRILTAGKRVKVNDRPVLLCNAEAHLHQFKIPMILNRPRLYQFEDFPFEDRNMIFLHVKGVSHGQMPEHIVDHILDKYGEKNIVVIGPREDWIYKRNMHRNIHPNTLWELASIISKARMFIGVDSGPSWIAQCYPDVITKKVRLFPDVEALRNWVPLEWCRLGSYWDDRSAMIYNPSENDAGFTWSYKKI